MARLIIANRHGHQVVEWNPDTLDSQETQAAVVEVERLLREAREQGCRVSRKVGDQHVLDDGPFDPTVEEYQVIAPIAGG